MMHEAARSRLRNEFIRAAFCAGRPGADRPYFLHRADEILDEFLSCEFLATEWDAYEWGLDPDHWMVEERAEIRRRGGSVRPREAVDA